MLAINAAPGIRISTEREPRADHANEKCGHADSDQRELPDAGRDSERVGFAEV